jgi:translation initiation factor 2 beta subunit (eIF-2beta)/eIF-5
MKKLLLLFALIMAIHYSTAHSAEVIPNAKWQMCRNKVIQAEAKRSRENPKAFMEDLCGFYQKPIPECTKIMESASPQEMQQVIGDYLFHYIVLPKCGVPQ